MESGKFWLYPKLWPVKFDNFNKTILDKLTLPADNIINQSINGNSILIMDETRNPTLSYKDRASSLVALKAIELGIDRIAAASTGNAGSSLAGICARLGLKSHIYVPKNIPDAKRIQIEAYGANIVVVDGDYDFAFDKCLEDSKINSWYNRNTAYNPLTIEGKKSAAYDIFIQTKGNIPDIIFVPVGDGVIISGIFKGFSELLKLGWIKNLPQLIAVQSNKSDAVINYLSSNKFVYKPATTIADSISAGAPRNLYMAANAVMQSGGFGISVSDENILQSQKEFIIKTGILCEPSSAATYAAYKLLINENKLQNKSVLLLITGNGLKDIESLKR
ncbi:MAG: pyridoxal-phosphate dependent enzyme [Bacteroidetes bacterium]|nr:pyridoxal-phosphate dependent enzyme [Bacteroidota bacterium]MBU1115573.1 pyridoxal-phosphate dependent enzyme [Bacteroidota bacterium]MBU1799645.1 pyridoxal-phosphate dependent enzyme [Bacteroidota bacterium]